MSEPLLLDAFCGAGGATQGYQRAGFRVIGVDIDPQPDYCGDEFIQGEAIEFILEHGHEFDAIHASPPCQNYIAITRSNRKRKGWADNYIDLAPPTRRALADVRALTAAPTVIECGVGRHLRRDVQLCGEMFGLGVIRHRTFEIDGVAIPQPTHLPHRGRVAGWRHGEYFDGPYVAVYGDGGGKGSVGAWQHAMGIDWTESRHSLAEAVPPAYTVYVGQHLIKEVTR